MNQENEVKTIKKKAFDNHNNFRKLRANIDDVVLDSMHLAFMANGRASNIVCVFFLEHLLWMEIDWNIVYMFVCVCVIAAVSLFHWITFSLLSSFIFVSNDYNGKL